MRYPIAPRALKVYSDKSQSTREGRRDKPKKAAHPVRAVRHPFSDGGLPARELPANLVGRIRDAGWLALRYHSAHSMHVTARTTCTFTPKLHKT